MPIRARPWPHDALLPAMHIVLDGSPLTVESGGIKRYAMQLALALRELPYGDQVTFLCDRPILKAGPVVRAGIQVHDQPATGWRRRWWSLGVSSVAEDVNATVFHGVDFAVPYRHRHPAVMTIHDLSPWRYSQWQPEAKRIRRRTPWLLRLGMADMVTTVSEAVREEVIDYFQLDPQRVVATPLAADARFRPVSCAGPPPRFFLFVGTNEPRKNLTTLVEAWRQLPSEGRPELWIAGRMREDGMPLPQLPGLVELGVVPDEELAPLYSSAIATVYPSVYEGFGLPVLEAMQCGSPVVAGNCPALREVAGNAGMLLPPEIPSLWRDALQQLAANDTLRKEMQIQSLQRSAAFTWRATAEKTRLVYLEAISRFGR